MAPNQDNNGDTVPLKSRKPEGGWVCSCERVYACGVRCVWPADRSTNERTMRCATMMMTHVPVPPNAAHTHVPPPPQTKQNQTDTAFKQQRLPAWQPILTPKWVIISFTLIGLVFLPLGIVLKAQSDAIVEYALQYDGKGTGPEFAACQVTFTVDRDMKAPVYVYYQLDGFYQNHRRYVKSRSDAQLMGDLLTEPLLSACDPLRTITDAGVKKVLNPCGLIANRCVSAWDWAGLG